MPGSFYAATLIRFHRTYSILIYRQSKSDKNHIRCIFYTITLLVIKRNSTVHPEPLSGGRVLGVDLTEANHEGSTGDREGIGPGAGPEPRTEPPGRKHSRRHPGRGHRDPRTAPPFRSPSATPWPGRPGPPGSAARGRHDRPGRPWALVSQASTVDHDQVQGNLLDLGQDVAGQEDCGAGLPVNLAIELTNLMDARRVQFIGGLVQHQQARVA